MARYFLHVQDGDRLEIDEEGQSFRDTDAARREAISAARELWAETIRAGEERDYLQAAIIIADQRGRQVARVSFLEALPAGLRNRLSDALPLSPPISVSRPSDE